jgi:hypothetical protein
MKNHTRAQPRGGGGTLEAGRTKSATTGAVRYGGGSDGTGSAALE